MQLKEFFRILRARWRIVAASIVLSVLAATLLTLLTKPVYEARARVYLSAENDETKKGAAQGVFVLTSDDLDTYVEVLNTPAVLDPLRQELGMEPGHPIDVSASVTGTTSILDIRARAGDAQEAADVANEVGPQLGEVAGKFSTLLASSGQKVVSTPIAAATPPGAPTSPNPKRNLALALLTGLALGIGLALLRHTLDSKVRSEEDIKLLSDAPLLASLPMDRKGAEGGLLAIEEDPHGQYAEAVRRLRTNLMFVDVTTGRHSFVITSAVPGEGKTTTAVNLALSVADSGLRTLLVDGDLRNPSVAKLMGLEGSVGLTTVLLGRASLDEVVQPWGASNLDVLPAGQIPPNPSELLGSGPMEELVAKIQAEYDFVLFDSPPVVPVIDAVILERLAGGLLMVVGTDHTLKKDLASAVKQLTTVGVTISGFSRNLVSTKGGGAYRYGYYRYEAQTQEQTRRGRKKTTRREQPRTRVRA